MSPLLLAVLAAAATLLNTDVSAQKTKAEAKAVTILSGCLRQSRADTTTANQKGVIYTLEADTQKLPTSPAPEGSGPIQIEGRYALSFESPMDVSKHVDQRVEVWGRVMPRSAAAKATDKDGAVKPLPGAAQQMFHVTTLKMISPRCRP